jgi:glucosamine--fructose-6-phosphate aminotransferase (isomerizing)
MPPGKVFGDMKSLAQRLHKLQAETLAIASVSAKLPPVTRSIRVPGDIPEVYSPIPYIVPAQIFAALLAEVKGLDPDHPRSLHIVTRTV